MHLNSTAKVAAGLVIVWLIVAPFIAGWFPSPGFVLNSPWLLLFGVMVLLSMLAWAARKLHL
jgi:hypothetical protein